MRKFAVTTSLLAVLLAGCGSTDAGGDNRSCHPVVALVASSVVDAFGEVAGNPCADMWKVTGGSSTALVAQVREGSPADAFVAAGKKAISQLQEGGLAVGDPVLLGSVGATLYVSGMNRGHVTLDGLPQLVADG